MVGEGVEFAYEFDLGDVERRQRGEGQERRSGGVDEREVRAGRGEEERRRCG